MHIVRHLAEDVWRDFVDRHPHGNIFHTPEMFQVFARARGYRPSLWAATRNDGSVLALLLPVHVTLSGGPMSLVTTRALAYGSVLVDPSPEGEAALSSLLQVYNRQVSALPLFTELRNLSDLSDSQTALQANGFTYEEHLNYLLDLRRDPDAILQSFNRKLRQHIRQQIKHGVIVVEPIKDRTGVDALYDLVSRTYRSARVPLADRSLFQAAYDILLPKGMARFTMSHVGDTPASAAAVLLYKDIIFGWYNGMDRSFGAFRPNEMLVWDIVKWGAEHGYGLLDFGGAGKPSEEYGVRDFKSKFHGQLVNYGRNIRIHARWRMMISMRTNQLARQAILMLDRFRFRKVGGKIVPEADAE